MFPAASVASGSQVILHELLPLPPILVALSALALGLFGAQAGLQRRSATEAFAERGSEIRRLQRFEKIFRKG